MFNFKRDCTIIRRTAGTVLDDYGNAVAGTVHVEAKCELQQIRRDEPERAGETSVATWDLFLPMRMTGGGPPVDIELDTSDVVVIDGDTYELTGAPWFADTGSTAVHHIECTVIRAE